MYILPLLSINWRMPKCNSVLQTEIDLFQREIPQICPKNATFQPFSGLQNPQKPLDIAQLNT